MAIVFKNSETVEGGFVIRHDFEIEGGYITSDCKFASEDTSEVRAGLVTAFRSWLSTAGFDPDAS